MVISVAGRVHGDPLSAGQPDHLSIVESHRWLWQLMETGESAGIARMRICRFHDISIPGPPHGVGSHGIRSRPWRDLLDVKVWRIRWIPHDVKRLVSYDFSTTLGSQPLCATEMVRMAMSHDDGVNPLKRVAGCGES